MNKVVSRSILLNLFIVLTSSVANSSAVANPLDRSSHSEHLFQNEVCLAATFPRCFAAPVEVDVNVLTVATQVQNPPLSFDAEIETNAIADIRPVTAEPFSLGNAQPKQNNLFSQLVRPPTQTDTHLAGDRPLLKIEPESPDDPLFRPRADLLLNQRARYSPGIAIFNPTAFGQSLGDVAVGIGFQERTRFSNKADGGVGIGFGVGDPKDLVGLDVNIAFTDLSNFFDRGIVGFQLHRLINDDLAIAVGVDDALTWGDGDLDGPSPYGVISKLFRLHDDPQKFLSQITVSAGVGTGRYRTIPDIDNNRSDPNVFSTVSFRVWDPVNVITEWTGQDLTVGLSVRPFPNVPFILTPGFTDITGNAGDGWRFVMGAGYSFRF